MINSIKSEFRKLLSVRSTYFIVLVDLIIAALFGGYGSGFRASKVDLHNPALLATQSFSAIAFGGFIMAIAGLLLFGNEYRWNAIMYTLTSSNNRLKSLFAKFLVVSVFALFVSALLALYTPVTTLIGLHFADKTAVAQHFGYGDVLWKSLLCGWGYAMYAFALVAIMRNQIGAIVTFLIVPLIGENILMGVFKSSAPYLPFTSLQSIVMPDTATVHVSLTHNVVVSLCYVIGSLLIATVLFVRRDAN